MNINLKIISDEIQATPDGVARAIKLRDQPGNDYGQVTWVWDEGALMVTATKLPDGFEGKTLGVEDMDIVQILPGDPHGDRVNQAQDAALQLMLWGAGVVPIHDDASQRKPSIGPLDVEVLAERGQIIAKVESKNGFIEIHVMHAAGQPPFFVVLADSMANKVISTIRSLVDGVDLPSSTDITDMVDGAQAAGTGARIEKVEASASRIGNEQEEY